MLSLMGDDAAEKKAAIEDLRTDIRRYKHDQANRKAMMQGLDPNSKLARDHVAEYGRLEQNITQAEQKIKQLGG